MRILVTGKNGQLGSEIARIQALYPHTIIFKSSQECDITNLTQVEKRITDHKIEAIINCAAYTAVDKAEDEREKAFAVNETGVANLVALSEKHNLKLIHISTDYVFDGTKKTPYLPSDRVSPIGVYGASKRAGEEKILQSTSDSIVIRTSWVFSSFGNNFVKTMLRLGSERDELNVVSDQVGCPTYAHDLAQACLEILLSTKRLDLHAKIYHFCNAGETNWSKFARAIFKNAGVNCKVIDIPTSAYPTKAKRPAYSVLNVDDLKRDFGVQPRTWEEALKDCLEIQTTTR